MKKTLLVVLWLTTQLQSWGQNTYSSSGRKKQLSNSSGFDKSKLVYGSGFNFYAGNTTYFSLTPVIGYKIVEPIAVGIGLGYQYQHVANCPIYNRIRNTYDPYTLKANYVSPSLWAKAIIFNNVFLCAQLERNIVYRNDFEYDNTNAIVEKNVTIKSNSTLVGLGFKQAISDRVSFLTSFLFDVGNDPYSPYRQTGNFTYDAAVVVGF